MDPGVLLEVRSGAAPGPVQEVARGAARVWCLGYLGRDS